MSAEKHRKTPKTQGNLREVPEMGHFRDLPEISLGFRRFLPISEIDFIVKILRNVDDKVCNKARNIAKFVQPEAEIPVIDACF